VIVSKPRSNHTPLQVGVLIFRERLPVGSSDPHGVQGDVHRKKIRDVELVGELNAAGLLTSQPFSYIDIVHPRA
jgi:hypothetical protein